MFHVKQFDCSDRAIGQRLKSIREARKETGLAFSFAIRSATGKLMDPSKISKIENGKQTASFDDIAHFAALDPAQRGREWLAWGVREPEAPVMVDGVPFEEGTPVTPEENRQRRVAEGGQSYRASDASGASRSRGQQPRKRRRPK